MYINKIPTAGEKRGPWTIKSSQVKYQNDWMLVREDEVLRPDGKDGIYGVVEASFGVMVLPMDEEGNVFLVKQYRYGVERETLEVVSGGIDEGENPINAAKRELLEETGLMASEWIEMGKVDPFTSIVRAPSWLFLAKKLEKTEAHQDDTENIELVKIPFAQAVKMAMDDEISEGVGQLLIFKVNEKLKNG